MAKAEKILHRVFNDGLTLLVRCLVGLLSRLDRRAYPKFVERLCFNATANNRVKDYVTLLIRPKKVFRREVGPVHSVGGCPVILIQGQIVRDDQFTIETIKLYKRIFPSIPLVVATWEDEAREDLEEIAALGARVVLCKKPFNSGFLNFNFQRETTVRGLEAARETGADQVLKTRSDQRIYSRYAVVFLQALLSTFPAGKGLPCNGRVFVLSTTTLTNVPLHVCDMLQFGFIDDVCKFWSAPAHSENVDRAQYVAEMEGKLSTREILFRTPTNPEAWLGRHFAAALYGNDALCDPKAVYVRLAEDAIGIIDQWQLDLCWPKYNSIEEFRDYQVPWTMERFSSEKWLALYSRTVANVISYDPNAVI